MKALADLEPVDTLWQILGACFILMLQVGYALVEAGCIGHNSHQAPSLLRVRATRPFATHDCTQEHVCASGAPKGGTAHDARAWPLARLLCKARVPPSSGVKREPRSLPFLAALKQSKADAGHTVRPALNSGAATLRGTRSLPSNGFSGAEQNMLNTSVATICWLAVGHGVFSQSGPALFGSQGVFFASAREEVMGSKLIGALLGSTTSSLVGAAVAERMDSRAFLLVASLLAALGVPVAARSIWYSQGALT